MPRRPPRLLTQQRLITCILTNQLATPGLGSLMAGRTVAGACQLALALAGCALILVWIFEVFYRITLQQLDQPAPHAASDWMWRWGLALFAASWCWSLVTSFRMWTQAKRVQSGGGSSDPPGLSPDPDARHDH